jgi:F420-non-reducing hydrogenase iron-sulfur subunit
MAFEPRLVGFLCNWCSYAGADLAGVSRFQYPPNVRVIRVMCSGRVDPVLIIEALMQGADGVLIGGCHPGDCHYITGNYYAEKKVNVTKELLRLAGIEPERLRLEWISASEGERFASMVSDFVNQVKALGPSPVTRDEKVMLRLSAAAEAAKFFRLRLLSGKEIKLTGEGNVYGERLEGEKMESMLMTAAGAEYKRSLILELTKRGAMSVRELASEIGEPTDITLDHVVALRSKNLLAMSSIDGFTPRYKAIIAGGA